MFKLTKREQTIVAFLVGAIVVGTLVKEWRVRRAERPPPAARSMKE